MSNFDWRSVPTYFDDIDRERQGAEAVSFARQALINSQIDDLIGRGYTDADVLEEMAHRKVAVTADQIAEVRRRR